MIEIIIDGSWDADNNFDYFDCKKWLDENKILYKEWEENLTEMHHYIFYLEEDAMAFKLTFG